MKKLFAFILALTIICTNALAVYDGEILFRGIPWMCSIDEAVEQFTSDVQGLDGDIFEDFSQSSWNFDDGVRSDVGFCYHDIFIDDTFLVGGHSVGSVNLYALYDCTNGEINKDKSASKYYRARYNFRNRDKNGNDKIYSDLRARLTDLYGKPDTLNENEIVWLGKNGTAVRLDRKIYIVLDSVHDTGVTLEYGFVNDDEMISELIAVEVKNDTTGAYDGL